MRFSRAFDGFIKKEYKDKWAPFMFMSVLSIVWGILDVMTPESCVRSSVLGHSGCPSEIQDPTHPQPRYSPHSPHSGRKGNAWTPPSPRGRQALPRPTPPTLPPFF